MLLARRTFLQGLGLGAAAALTHAPLTRAFMQLPESSKDFFIIIHQAGGWDVTLWSDPRNRKLGLIEPATTETCETAHLRGWIDHPLDGATSFRVIDRGDNPYGPALGSLLELYDRLTIINGIAMNTLSHPDGTCFSVTGRHLSGGRPVASSIDTLLGHALGVDQLLPVVSLSFPSAFIGADLDVRALPLRVSDLTAVSKSLRRANLYSSAADRDSVTALLAAEARSPTGIAIDSASRSGLAEQYAALRKLLSSDQRGIFDADQLERAHPRFDYQGKYQGEHVVHAAFAIEAIRHRLLRCVSFQMASCDTHNNNYRYHPAMLQETFEMIATLIRELDDTRFDDSNDKLSDHVHILVVSDFCRTPQINLTGGRDHYPNNSALVISPRFRGKYVFGKTDPEQLLPLEAAVFSDGARAITPADVLATFLGAVGIDPRKYMRDGEVISALLA